MKKLWMMGPLMLAGVNAALNQKTPVFQPEGYKPTGLGYMEPHEFYTKHIDHIGLMSRPSQADRAMWNLMDNAILTAVNRESKSHLHQQLAYNKIFANLQSMIRQHEVKIITAKSPLSLGFSGKFEPSAQQKFLSRLGLDI